MSDAESSSSGLDMARHHQRAPLRNGAGGQGRPSGPSGLGVAMVRADEYPLHGSDSHAEAEDLEIEDDDDVHEDAAALFGIDVGDDGVPNNVIDVNAGDDGGGPSRVLLHRHTGYYNF